MNVLVECSVRDHPKSDYCIVLHDKCALCPFYSETFFDSFGAIIQKPILHYLTLIIVSCIPSVQNHCLVNLALSCQTRMHYFIQYLCIVSFPFCSDILWLAWCEIKAGCNQREYESRAAPRTKLLYKHENINSTEP